MSFAQPPRRPSHGSPATREALPTGSCHVWFTLTDAVSLSRNARRYEALLSEHEKERHRRFYYARDRNLYLVAHALVRTVLSRYEPIAPGQWRFVTVKRGRPEIDPQLPHHHLRFNLSHTRGLVACAVCREVDVGVDVETTDRRVSVLKLAESVFSSQEVADLRSRSGDAQRHRFFEYWTLKEAYIKADGSGLSLPLKSITFSLSDGDPVAVAFDERINDDPGTWTFAQRRPSARHHLAVAVRVKGDLELVVRSTVP